MSSTLALSAIVMRAGNGKVLPKVAVQPVHRIGEGGLLVVHRDHDVEHGHAGGAGGQGGVRPRFEVDSVIPAGVGFEGDVCHDIHGRAAACVLPLGRSYAPAMSSAAAA